MPGVDGRGVLLQVGRFETRLGLHNWRHLEQYSARSFLLILWVASETKLTRYVDNWGILYQLRKGQWFWGGLRSGNFKWNLSTRAKKKTAILPSLGFQISHDMIWDRTRATGVENRWLITFTRAWPIARLRIILKHKKKSILWASVYKEKGIFHFSTEWYNLEVRSRRVDG
jgi:hypothetical protein